MHYIQMIITHVWFLSCITELLKMSFFLKTVFLIWEEHLNFSFPHLFCCKIRAINIRGFSFAFISSVFLQQLKNFQFIAFKWLLQLDGFTIWRWNSENRFQEAQNESSAYEELVPYCFQWLSFSWVLNVPVACISNVRGKKKKKIQMCLLYQTHCFERASMLGEVHF